MADEDVINNIIKKEIRNRQKKTNDVSTNITSSKSFDEDKVYNLLLKQKLKSNKKKTSKKTVTRVDKVLPKKTKRKKDKSKNNTSTAHKKNMLRENILEAIVGKSISVSKSNSKKQKQKTHDEKKSINTTTIIPSNLSNDEEYTSLLNTSVKKMKNNKRKRSKDMIGVDAVNPKGVKTPKRQKFNSKNYTSSAHMGKMLNEQIMKSTACKSSPDVDSTTINTSIISVDEEYTSLLNTFVKKIKKNKKKKQNIKFNKDTSSVFTNKMHNEQNLESVICISSYSNSEVKKEKAKIQSKNKNLDSTAMNTSNISDDEDYKSLLNTFIKKIKKNEKKRTKTEKKVDTVLSKEVKKTKQQKDNLKKDTSSVYINKMYHGHILESIDTNSSESNSQVKKEKAKTCESESLPKVKTHMDLTIMNTSSMSDDENYTSLLNTFVKKIKKKKKKRTKISSPKPPSPEMQLIENPSHTEFPYLLGLEHVIDFIINDEMIAMAQTSGKNSAAAVAANLAELQRHAVDLHQRYSMEMMPQQAQSSSASQTPTSALNWKS